MAASKTLTAEERVLRARMAGNATWAKVTDRTAATAPAREGWLAKLEREVDPEGVMDPETRAAAVENARRAHMARMSFLAAKAARKAREERKAARDAETLERARARDRAEAGEREADEAAR
ncbi:hypothetical protein LO762_16565 [Actinocorallia sp. API 0066]|uniref:hypothetical protein n=1 Tax=Actinocorallia sp. API 0066 TaxID=2896846 RepID=UPI001E462CC9|nr:hypothetical protein [Actinocorallia sp. API 0066]MCD0450792.1 hypothetical protein [Actinocorallia sp. API 0066]